MKLKRLYGADFKLEIDANDDVFEMGAMQQHRFGTMKKKMAIWIRRRCPEELHAAGEPLLDRILGVPTHGFDF